MLSKSKPELSVTHTRMDTTASQERTLHSSHLLQGHPSNARAYASDARTYIFIVMGSYVFFVMGWSTASLYRSRACSVIARACGVSNPTRRARLLLLHNDRGT